MFLPMLDTMCLSHTRAILFTIAILLSAGLNSAFGSSGPGSNAVAPMTVSLEPGEKIWAGVIKDGERMPLAAGYAFDFYANNRENQIQPLLLGNKGLWVWSEEPYAFELYPDKIIITKRMGEVKSGRAGKTLAEASRYASQHFFPPSGRKPDEQLFAKPQYNTWIELTYNQNQKDILKYARAVIDNGFAPGVLMLDDTWQEDYGLWNFHPGRFPDPKTMIAELHKLGFKVMLWICPFVSPDQAALVRQLLEEKCFLMQKTPAKSSWKNATDPAIIKWWNGYSALLDFTNPSAVRWFNAQLDNLVKEYGVDGFKFDAGDTKYYPTDALSMKSVSPNRQSELYAQFGLRFPLNEYRACWKMAGQPLGQRLHDKSHTWKDAQKLIPQMLVEGISGYAFSCPDMIGGGDYTSFIDCKSLDQDLVVRSAQIHALMPMMQFSAAPWRVLDAKHLDAVKKAVNLREQFTPTIMELVRRSVKTGEPIVCSLEYQFPNQGMENVNDEFMLGDSILVAPIDKPGFTRKVILPPGDWIGDDGKIVAGPALLAIDAPIDRLPYFRKAK
jgi:alpha-glucosidase